MATELSFGQLFIPIQNANEAAATEGVSIIPITCLQEAIDILEKRSSAAPFLFKPLKDRVTSYPNFSEIKSQENAKRALTIAVAGGHNIYHDRFAGRRKKFDRANARRHPARP